MPRLWAALEHTRVEHVTDTVANEVDGQHDVRGAQRWFTRGGEIERVSVGESEAPVGVNDRGRERLGQFPERSERVWGAPDFASADDWPLGFDQEIPAASRSASGLGAGAAGARYRRASGTTRAELSCCSCRSASRQTYTGPFGSVVAIR